MEKKDENNLVRQNAGVMIMIVAMLIVVFGLFGYIVYDKFLFSDKKDNTEEKTNTNDNNKSAEEKETELIDSTIENQLVTNIKILELLEFLGKDVEHYYRHGDIYYKNIKSQDIDNGVKLYAVLRYAYDDENIFITDHTSSDSAKVAESGKVNTIYKNLFGENSIPTKIEKYSCPYFEYNESTKKYRGISACGGTSGFWILTKANKFTYAEDNYYVYVNLAVIEGSEKAYTDYNKANLYQGTVSKDSMRDSEKFFNEVDKDKFSEYKYTFTKTKDGYYKFVSVEKVK